MNRVYCLYRVSTEKQADENRKIQLQQIACRKYLQDQDWVLTKEFTEIGVSGYKTNLLERTALQQILDDARSKLFDILLVFMYDRIGRRARGTSLIIPILQQLGIRVCSVKEGELKLSDASELMQYLRFWSAENESRHTLMRVHARLKQLVSNGEYRGGAIPFGYKLHRGILGDSRAMLIQNPKETAIVKFIFDFYLKEQSVSAIQNELAHKGYYPRKGNSWSRSSIYAILKNVVYTGRLKYGTTLSPFIEKLRIISQEQFEQVQNLLKSKISSTKDNQEKCQKYNVVCECCQVALKLKGAKKTVCNKIGRPITYKREYYFCPCAFHPTSIKKYYPLSDVNQCFEKKMDDLLAIACSDLNYTIRRFHMVRNRLGVERRETKEQIEELKRRKNNFVIEAIENGERETDKQFDTILSEIAVEERKLKKISLDLENIKAFLDVLKRDRETTNKKCLLKILFLSIMLDRTGNVKFEYNLSGEIICDINEKKNHYG